MKKVAVALVLVFLAYSVWYFGHALGFGAHTTAELIAQSFARKYDKPVKSIIIDVTIDTGKFAKGSIQYEGQFGGGLWFAAKTEKGWEIAFDGNGIIPCSAADSYHFPAAMVPACIDTEHGNELMQR